MGDCFKRSNAARLTHMNAVCAAEVPAVWTTLFSQRLKSRKMMPSERYPKNAATTDTFGPNPSFKTMYGYDAPMTAATTRPATTERAVNSRVPGGLAMTPRIGTGSATRGRPYHELRPGHTAMNPAG